MSITIDYFFNSPLLLVELAKEFRTWIGCDLHPYEGDTEDWYSRLLGMEFSLSTHEFKNDGHLNYEDYRYRTDIRTPWPDAEFRPLQLITMAGLVYTLHRRLKITGMLMFDLDTMLGRYEERPGLDGSAVLFDITNNQQVIFPGYLATLFARVPANGLDDSREQSIADYLRSVGRDIRPA